jgi:hypothetical protein
MKQIVSESGRTQNCGCGFCAQKLTWPKHSLGNKGLRLKGQVMDATPMEDRSPRKRIQVPVRDELDRLLSARERCRRKLNLPPEVVDRMIKDFLAARGGITVCPPAYVAFSPQYSR